MHRKRSKIGAARERLIVGTHKLGALAGAAKDGTPTLKGIDTQQLPSHQSSLA